MNPTIRSILYFPLYLLDWAFFAFIWVLGNLLLRPYFRLSCTNPPKTSQPYIIAANHASLLDGVVLQAVLTRRLCFFLTITFYKMPILRWFFRAMHFIPIFDAGGNKNALIEGSDRLHKGESIGIFPEGEVSRTGTLGKGKPGVAILAETAQVVVIPAAVVGSYQALPRRNWFPKPYKIEIRFGEALAPPPRIEGPRRERYREFTDRVMSEISALLQEK